LRPMTAVAMHTFSPALRVRRKFMRLGLLISALAFVVVGGDVLLEQWIEGYASTLFIFGTACLIAAACTLLFAIIAVIGLVTSRVYTDESWRVGQNSNTNVCVSKSPERQDRI
jgi:hypothetical protein